MLYMQLTGRKQQMDELLVVIELKVEHVRCKPSAKLGCAKMKIGLSISHLAPLERF